MHPIRRLILSSRLMVSWILTRRSGSKTVSPWDITSDVPILLRNKEIPTLWFPLQVFNSSRFQMRLTKRHLLQLLPLKLVVQMFWAPKMATLRSNLKLEHPSQNTEVPWPLVFPTGTAMEITFSTMVHKSPHASQVSFPLVHRNLSIRTMLWSSPISVAHHLIPSRSNVPTTIIPCTSRLWEVLHWTLKITRISITTSWHTQLGASMPPRCNLLN